MTEEGIRPLTDAEFEQIRLLAYNKFGLDLRDGKQQLVSARLGKHLRRLGFRNFRDYSDYVKADASGQALTDMIDALTTNFTSFLREPVHFEFLRKTVIPAFRGRGPIEIWSAACATGEEPYSIALSALEEMGDEARHTVRVLATDISTRALETARRGVYPAERLSGIAPEIVRRYFLRGEQRWRGWFRVRKALREMVEFRRLNLTEPFPALPRFAVIFCRNVMIYFNSETQQNLVSRLARSLEPGGFLLTGHSESLLHGSHPLDYVRPATYRLPGARA
ncbi:MAG: CheR family methyltransferase [Acidobacteriota bacterium]